ncbi:MAG: ABC transporter permease, partial [Acidobacteriaceae bacterium]|nr:ABC transporter permease [Acidobacteriaceae bacterium]
MSGFWQEIRYAFRTLAHNPAVSIVCVLTLALGIGANTTVFSIVDSMFLRPLPIKNPQQFMVLALEQKTGSLSDNFSVPELRDLQRGASKAFSDVIGEQLGLDGLDVGGQPERIVTAYVTGNFFSGLGLQPANGQLIRPGQGEIPGADPVVVLSYRYWQRRFRSDPSVVGRKASLDGHPVTIIGIAPRGFRGLHSFIDT